MIFNIYNRDKRSIQISTETPSVCTNCIEEKNKKCQNFYDRLCSDGKEREVYVCPYGLCAYKTPNGIYTCLNIAGKTDLTKLVPNLKRYKQNPSQFTQYTLSQITKIIDEEEKTKHNTEILRVTIHDIKNATKHFIDLVEDVKNDDEVNKIAESNDKLFSSVEGYNLIQYRLAYHDKLLNYGDSVVEIGYINFHQAIKKLSKLLMYRGMKKGVRIEFDGYWKHSFRANKDLYLMYFILIENALKFAKENTDVFIRFSKNEQRELKIEIQNECYPLMEDEVASVFTTGFRSLSAIKTSKGSGLGLALAKRIADVSNVQLTCRHKEIEAEKGLFTIECIHKRPS